MAQSQNFRTAFNGFNREDVVHYLEYLNARHQSQIQQLTAEAEKLRERAAQQPEDSQERIAALEAENEELTRQLEQVRQELEQTRQELEQARQELEQARQPAEKDPEPESPVPDIVDPELSAYRRAEAVEYAAKRRAELIYHQANGVLTEATNKVEGLSDNITQMADQAMSQLTQLQVAVSGSKQTLQEVLAIMKAIRPNP